MRDDNQYFENLANGGSAETGTEQGTYEVELAKAGASSMATRSKTAHEKEGKAWDDDGAEGQLTVDVYQTPEDIVVESAIAGVRPDDIDVDVTADSISIRGSRRREKTVKNEDYLYQECYWGRFARSIILPQEVDPENAEVTFKNGILTVHLPKVNKRKSRKLRVKVE